MVIVDRRAATHQQLRPVHRPGSHFPVYRNLTDIMAGTKDCPDDNVAHTLGACAGYACSSAETLAMIMALWRPCASRDTASEGPGHL